MKAAVLYTPGPPENLTVTTVPDPALKPGWTLVRVRAFGINHSEIFTRQGHSPSVTFPRILGIEAVGQVEETTDPALTPGQTVVSFMGEMGRAYDGGYAEKVLLPNHQVHPVSTHLTWENLAAVPETYYTALGSVEALNIQPGSRVLIRAATSGVGVAAARLIRALHPHTHLTGSTRDLTKTEQLIAAGFTDVVHDRAGQLTPVATYDRVLDLIGPATVKDSLALTNPGGIVCSTGQLGGEWTLDLDPIFDIPNNRYLTGFYSGDIDRALLQRVFDILDRHTIDVTPALVLPLDDIAAAHRRLESNHSFGKIVITTAPHPE